jgi:hypothetical protein
MPVCPLVSALGKFLEPGHHLDYQVTTQCRTSLGMASFIVFPF